MSSSDQHKELTTRCHPWIRRRITGRGIRSGFEVPLAGGYIADWVCLCGMQWRHERQYIPERELERRDGVLVSPEFACVFETKVGRSDLRGTFGKGAIEQSGRLNPIGSLHWVVIPKTLLEYALHLRLPRHWGILVEAGRGLREIRSPAFNSIDLHALFRIGYHLLWYGKESPG